ncbi:MAG: hypothetical protein ACRDPW_06950 [Mycobacteriales bacterium]
MVAVVLPVGHYLGQFFTSEQAADPETHEVRLGDEVFELSLAEYAVWGLAHSDLETLQKTKPGRPAIEADAKELGVTDPTVAFTDLLGQGLLTQVMPVGSAVRRFAEQYQVTPLALGLGNTAEQLGTLLLGHPEQPRVGVGYEVYRVWAFAGHYPSLWDTCVSLAEPTADNQTSTDPAFLLNSFFDVLPALLSVSCVYIDRRRP